MQRKKIDILIITLLGVLLVGLGAATFSPVRDSVLPTFTHNFYVRIYSFFLLLVGINILAGLGLLRVRDDAMKKLGTLTWILEMAVALFVFMSVFFLRLNWGILPFYAGLRQPVVISLRILPAVAIFVAGVIYLSRCGEYRFGLRELTVLAGLSFLLNLAVVAINPSFLTGITAVFNRTNFEYYGDIGKVDHRFFFHYVDKMPYLSLHGKTHPPLATLFLWAMTKMGIGIFGASILTALFGSLTLFFVYGIARDMFNEEAARVGVGIFWLVPSVVLYSAVCMDVFFMFLCAAAVFFFQRTLQRVLYSPFFALSFSLALFSTFAAGLLLLTFAIWVGWGYLQKSLPPAALKNLAVGAGLVLAVHAALYWGLNYNVAEVFFRAHELNALVMSKPRLRPYSYWVVGNMVDYFSMLGFPLFSMVCFYIWRVKKKCVQAISPLCRFCSPYLYLTSPA